MHLRECDALRYTILHQGVPVGTVDLPIEELAVGRFEPAAGYAALRPVIQEASLALLSTGVFGVVSATENAPDERMRALRAAAVLQFELEDRDGHLVSTDFVNLVEYPDSTAVWAIARLRGAGATVQAVIARTSSSQPDELPPGSE